LISEELGSVDREVLSKCCPVIQICPDASDEISIACHAVPGQPLVDASAHLLFLVGVKINAEHLEELVLEDFITVLQGYNPIQSEVRIA